MVSVLTISGMVAVHSKRAVFTALSGVAGVISAEVEMGRGAFLTKGALAAGFRSAADAPPQRGCRGASPGREA